MAADLLLGAGVRNRVVNSNFASNLRAAVSGAALAAGAYSFDCWKAGASGCTLVFAVGNPDTTVHITAGSLIQVIDGASIEGGVYTVSWAGTAACRVNGGAYYLFPFQVSLKAGQPVTLEFASPSSTYTDVSLGRVQLVPGDKKTLYERVHPALSALICSRYLQAYTNLIISGYNAASGLIYTDFAIPLMRTAVVPALSSITYSNASGLSVPGGYTSHYRARMTITAAGFGYATFNALLSAEL